MGSNCPRAQVGKSQEGIHWHLPVPGQAEANLEPRTHGLIRKGNRRVCGEDEGVLPSLCLDGEAGCPRKNAGSLSLMMSHPPHHISMPPFTMQL